MKDIPGYEGRYAITNAGRIWSYPKPITGAASGIRKGHWMKPMRSGHYLAVNLGANNLFSIHRLVAMTFHGPARGRHVNHRNGKKHDNRAENIEWLSQEDNNRHAWRTGLCRPVRAFTLQQALKIQIEHYKKGLTQKQIAERYGVGKSTIGRVINGTHGYPKPSGRTGCNS